MAYIDIPTVRSIYFSFLRCLLPFLIVSCSILPPANDTGKTATVNDFKGLWLLESTDRDEYELTEYASSLRADYDLLNDDPSLQCDPASWSRIYSNPNLVMQIGFDGTQVNLGYDLFDIRRSVETAEPYGIPSIPSAYRLGGDPVFERLGSSVAQLTDEELLITTANYKEGYLLTSIGIPQTAQAASVERFWLSEGKLHVELGYTDSAVFKDGFTSVHHFVPVEDEALNLYNCTSADYDWFNRLNAGQSENW